MSSIVMPLKKYESISYRVKCVAVENERVFGDVYVTQQTRNPTCQADEYHFPLVFNKRRSNLIRKTLEGPDFMEMNRKKIIRSASATSIKVTQKSISRSKSIGDEEGVIIFNRKNSIEKCDTTIKCPKEYPSPLPNPPTKEEVLSSLVDRLLLDIYGSPEGDRERSESESTASSLKTRPQHQYLQKARLLWKSNCELRILVLNLREHINRTNGILVRQLRRKDYLTVKRDKQCDIVTAHLQAYSAKRIEDTKMRFSLTPQPGESGFIQWLDAMKMVARLQGGIPPEFRKRLWLTLAERHLEQRGVDWKQAEKVCFNEWSNPDDEELGIQIVKDLHRTGCSLFCGAAGRDNQAVLRRVLLGFARWNKSVGYCQGLNVLAALVLQVMDRAESSAVKVMIYLIEGVLPEGYFADNLRGLSVDMAVFRDLLRSRLPKLSKHLEALQSDAKDKATGSSYEPPLTNVFTMQWFLTLFCHCLPQEAVLRVWDLIFLEGDEILLRTALAIWEGLSDRIMTVTSADEFYSIMGVLTREMLEFTDTNNLIKNIVSMGPLHGVTGLREKHRYNITPWARKLSDDEDSDTEEDERLAVAAAMFSMAQRLKKDHIPSTIGALQAIAPSSDRERLALDISTLKQQYAKLRERQRQAHIILSAACARQSMVPPPTSQPMNHLLVGKSALVSGKNRPLGLPSATATPKIRPAALHSPRSQNRRDRQGVTLHWKDTKRSKQKLPDTIDTTETNAVSLPSPQEASASLVSPKSSNADSDSDSTSTELCDEPDRLSDVDSEELTSASETYVMATDDEKNHRIESSPLHESTLEHSLEANDSTKADDSKGAKSSTENLADISIAKITDQIRRLSAEDDNNSMVPRVFSGHGEKSPDDPTTVGETNVDTEKSLVEIKVDYSSDTSIIRKSSVLDDYEYLSLSSNASSTKEKDVMVPEKHESEEMKINIVDPVQERRDSKSKHEDTTMIQRESTDFLPECSNILAETNYNKNADSSSYNASSDVAADERFKMAFDFSKHETTDVKLYEDSKVDSLIIDSSDVMKSERTFYSKTYVVGHIPISPMTVDQKLNKHSHGIGKVAGLSPESSANPEIALEKPIFNERKQTKTYDSKKSPKTPESNKSFSSGETMGPDSKPSSLTVSPRTPIRSESRDFLMDKSVCSSVSSDSKTLVLHSVDSDGTREGCKSVTKKTSYEKSSPSTPISSTDSLRNKSETSPKFVISSSSDSCSPSRIKSSERSFSSDLQSPISANSIKYTSNYNKRGQDNISNSPLDLSAATSPFYPIANPNQKTPSPYGVNRRRCSGDSTETSPEQKSSSSKDSAKYVGYQSKYESTLKSSEKETECTQKDDVYARSQFNLKREDSSASLTGKKHSVDEMKLYDSNSTDYYRKNQDFLDENTDDPLSEKDIVPCLPKEKLDKHYFNYNYRLRDRSKVLERSSSSLERRFADLKSSASTDEFATSMAKKRSSDILEDIKHLEAKALSDGTPDSGMMTKKSSYIWEDLKNLEARRQDTFSNSASNFSKHRLEIPNISVTNEHRKSYVVHPKMSIDENSDSILKSVTRNKNQEDSMEDGRESKVGVWTKVKPRKKGNNGRRSSDRALKIIQENSAILQKILACQAKKRLPDLEEISKEITISPINEEISKIFSPILEKMGLNEHEINEEVARINFKDFDSMTATSVSEFDAKINEELSKLSLIDDTEQMDQFDVDDVTSHEYLDTRESFIDRKINEELSKLLANYEENSASGASNLEKRSSSQNISDIEGLDISSISTNVFSYKSSNDSIETRSDLGSTQEPPISTEKFPQYTENVLPYALSKYRDNDSSPKSDIDIYRELEKLDKISSAQVLPDPSMEMPKEISPIPYVPNASPYEEVSPLRYSSKPGPYDTSPLKCSYDPYKSFDFKPRLSPEKTIASDPFAAVPYGKSIINTIFEYIDHELGISTKAYDEPLKSPVLTKESLEFRVRYDDEPSRRMSGEYLAVQSDGRPVINSNTGGTSYYSNGSSKPLTPTKYNPQEERCIDSTGTTFLEYSTDTSDHLLRRKYDPLSPKEYCHTKSMDYDRHLTTLSTMDSGSDIGSYLPTRHRDYHPLSSPNRQFGDQQYFPSAINHYGTKLSPGMGDETKRPVSHPEFPGKMTIGKYTDFTDRETSCYKKSSLSLGNIGHANKGIEDNYNSVTSPKTQFSPFPVRNAPRKPKELTLKLGLYSSQTSDIGQMKRS